MKSNYKILGNYIEKVEHRNINSNVTNLLGLSMTKEFRESTSNIIGTDLSVYKLIGKWHFACDFMSVIRVRKFPVVLQLGDEPTIVSPAYTVFKVKDSEILDPEYLMMWFRRPEFDRYAYFRCDGAVRGGFNWAELCESELPVPSIETQREIVKEYNTIVNLLKLYEKLNQKLEETTQALYKYWYVDFEFPDGNGKPYKSNGGEMVWCEELKQEIPKEWKASPISSFCDITSSKRIFEDEYVNSGVPFYRGKEISLKKSGTPINDPIYISEQRYVELASKYDIPQVGDILMTAVGTIGASYMVKDEKFYFKDGNIIWFKNFRDEGNNYYLYDFMQSSLFTSLINEITIGSTQNAITIITFGQQKIIMPCPEIMKKYKRISYILNRNLQIFKEIIVQLHLFTDVLYSKMSKPELLYTEQPA